MKKVLKILIPLIILGAIIYQFRNSILTRFFSSAPCTEPIPYTLGTFDPKFNISQKYFLSALSDAEAIWEKSTDLDLFVYAPESSSSDILKINLIYDYRQEATSKLASLGIIVNSSKASYDMLKIKFEKLKQEFEAAKLNYNARTDAFNQKQRAYETEVNFWNKKGGAPEAEYNKLQVTRLELEAEFKELQVLQKKINEMVDEINAFVVVLNRLANMLNLSVEKYNTINVARGESFTEGVYYSEGSSREIDIYEFSSRAKLVRVLAHELGHALDLGHVDDPKAIMYELNQDNNETLTQADLEALKAQCGNFPPG